MRRFDDLTLGDFEAAEKAGFTFAEPEALARYLQIPEEDTPELIALGQGFRSLADAGEQCLRRLQQRRGAR